MRGIDISSDVEIVNLLCKYCCTVSLWLNMVHCITELYIARTVGTVSNVLSVLYGKVSMRRKSDQLASAHSSEAFVVDGSTPVKEWPMSLIVFAIH